MLRRQRNLAGTAVVLGLAAGMLAGCAEQQPPINRVEAYALPKTLFQGEWYYQKTVIDVPGTRSVAFEGETSFLDTHRIRWDIQEGFLYARQSYEQIQGAKHVEQDSGEFKGAIVGAWKIAKHFDIKRGYNPTTGEENNVLMENSEDCLWYDCQYVRVDWSQNLATDWGFMHFDWGTFSTIRKDPVPFYWQDTSDERFKPVFDREAGYIDITTATSVAPQELHFPYWGITIPLCWLFGGDDASCNTEIVKVRNSFWRRAPNRDYEPRVHRGEKDEWFGYFWTARWNWLEKYGLLYKAKQHYLTRHNLWVASHYEDKPCTTDAECDAAQGSTCDRHIKFHENDVETDSDMDMLPDSFEEYLTAQIKAANGKGRLNPKSGDSDGDGVPDHKDDADGNGVRDIDDYYAWTEANMVHRCTIPFSEREPMPVVYFNTGKFPRSVVCDEDHLQTERDDVEGPCEQAYTWNAKGITDKAHRENTWSALHWSHHTYDESFWKVFLRGAYGWSDAEFQSWITTRDPNQGKAEHLSKFGDSTHGYYAFALCPNNPVQASDPWPCRFPRHSFAQAKELMEAGLTFNHTMSFAHAKQLLARGEEPSQELPLIRVGDIRYSYVNYAKDYSAVSPLGYGPNALDIRTGEILSGFANVYSAMDRYATSQQEAALLLNGRISTQEFVDGVNLDDFLEKIKMHAMHEGSGQRTVSPAELDEMYGSMKQDWMKKIQRLGDSSSFADARDVQTGAPLNNQQLRRKLVGSLARSDLFDMSKTRSDLSFIQGTPLEKQLMDNEVLLASGFAPGSVSEITPEVLQKASLARGGFLGRIEAREEFLNKLSERMNIDFYNADLVDDGLVGFAQRYKDLDPDQLWAVIRSQAMAPVVVHEMGHTIGLMHNFGGSDDAMNYFPEYWKLRTNDFAQTKLCNPNSPAGDQVCPFFVAGHEMTPYQLGTDQKNLQDGTKSLYEYAYTSIMDYDRYGTMMGEGLGRYDVAAMLYGYTDKVEVFKDVGAKMQGLLTNGVNLFEEWWDRDASVLMLYSDRAQSFHYTSWYSQMGDLMLREDNRELVDYRDVVKVRDANGRSDGWFYTDGNTRKVRVPYVYCSHSRYNISDSCMTWDWGTDQYERMKMHIDNHETWNILNAFPRGRYYNSVSSYISRQYGRFYKRMKNFNNGFAFYQGLFHQWYDQPAIDAFFTDPVNGYGAYTIAVHDSFNTLLRTMSMPDIKYFKDKSAQPDGQVIYSEADFSSEFTTGLTNARYFTTSYYNSSYERTCGYTWWECLHHFGYYNDKVLAMFILSDPRTYFVGKDDAEDIRQYRVSYFDNYTDQIIDFFGAMLSEDHEAIAPWYDPARPEDQTEVDNGVVWRNRIAERNYANPARDPAKPATGGAVESSTRFTLQLYGAVLGMFRFQNNFDNDFVERGRMWKKGKGTAWEITPTDKVDGTTEFVDPFTGTTYVGLSYTDGRGIAQRMLKHANDLKARTSFCSPTAGDPDACQAGNADAEGVLYEYRQLMDSLVQATTLYDNSGSNWSWNPFDP